MQHRIGLAIWSLHISAALYTGIGLLVPMLFHIYGVRGGQVFSIVVLLLCLALVVGIEIVNAGLRRRKFWAWVAGLCIFATYLPSLFLPLGALGLWGLLDGGSQAEFRVGTARKAS